MRKILFAIICLICFAVSVYNCSDMSLSVSDITADMEYYNQKAVDNLDSLIGRNKNEVEDWIYETYSADEIEPAEIKNDGANPAYLSKNGTVKIFFILDDDCNRFFIEPNIDESDYYNKEFASDIYKQKVIKYCADKNADYTKAPMINELCLYNFDTADKSTELVYYYLFFPGGSWGWYGDNGPYDSISFTYENGSFVASVEQ